MLNNVARFACSAGIGDPFELHNCLLVIRNAADSNSNSKESGSGSGTGTGPPWHVYRSLDVGRLLHGRQQGKDASMWASRHVVSAMYRHVHVGGGMRPYGDDGDVGPQQSPLLISRGAGMPAVHLSIFQTTDGILRATGDLEAAFKLVSVDMCSHGLM